MIALYYKDVNYINTLIHQVKAAFTRAYQKNPPMLPYVINSTTTAKKRSVEDNDLVEEEGDEEKTDNIDSDKMIKVALKIIFVIPL